MSVSRSEHESVNIKELQAAIRAETPVILRTITGEELEYKRVICTRPTKNKKAPLSAVLEDRKADYSVTVCNPENLIAKEVLRNDRGSGAS